MPDATPTSWRAIAGTVLFGGFALGYRASDGGAIRRLVLRALVAALAATVPIAIASRRPPIPPRQPGSTAGGADGGGPDARGSQNPVTFTVVVAARDEATVLPTLIADLSAQDHRTSDGRPLFELIVIDDRSVDGTPQAALRAAAAGGLGEVTRVVRRAGEGLADGKGAALTALEPEAYRGDVAVVLDADARVDSAYLSTLAHYVAHGAEAITGRRRILDADSSWLAGAQADEQTADGELQRGRWAMGGLSEFRGNGIIVRRDLLIEVGGWRAEALTEDVDLSSRIAAARGMSVAWAIDAVVWEEPVRTWPALWRQRVRWAEGGARRVLEHGASVLRSPRVSLRAKADFAAYVGQLAVPPVLLGVLAGALLRGRVRPAGTLLAAYGGTGALLCWDALRWETDDDGRPIAPSERARRCVRTACFATIWLAAVPAAWWRLATRRGAVVYDKMVHDGGRTPRKGVAGP